MKFKIITSFFVVLIPSTLFADIYTCLDNSGKRIFKDRPCKEITLQVDQSDRTKKKKPDNSGDSNQVITESELNGRWTDFVENDLKAYRSIWEFSYGVLRTRKANGVQHRHEYKLEGNKLRIFFSKEDAEFMGTDGSDIELLKFDGKTITMGEGAPAGQRYLHKL